MDCDQYVWLWQGPGWERIHGYRQQELTDDLWPWLKEQGLATPEDDEVFHEFRRLLRSSKPRRPPPPSLPSLYSLWEEIYTPIGRNMSRAGSKLTTTSYALLGLLAIKPWTAYGLAKQMDRNRAWPRASSKVYEEPKKLVEHGLARASREMTGERPSTLYSITPKGRRAFARWLDQPGGGPVLEFEQILKVSFAEHGSKQGLLTNVHAAKAWSRQRVEENVAIGQAYLEGRGPFPKRLAVILLTATFMSDFARLVGEWAEWAESVVATWPPDLRKAKPDLAALGALVDKDLAAHERDR
jgi:DNA-binding PadR family transcriptional regulator